jgi:D-3-phosphoglycerate dehydrogenase
VDLATAQIQGIPVFSSPYGHSTSVAELSISFIILLARQLGDRSLEVNAGEWNKVSSNCHEIRGKTLGILGYGHVGSQLGIMAEVLILSRGRLTLRKVARNESCVL